MFIWTYVSNVTTSYHSGGGVAVIAETLEEAHGRIAGAVPAKPDYWDEIHDVPWMRPTCGALDKPPDYVFDLTPDAEPGLIIFPDSGCC